MCVLARRAQAPLRLHWRTVSRNIVGSRFAFFSVCSGMGELAEFLVLSPKRPFPWSGQCAAPWRSLQLCSALSHVPKCGLLCAMGSSVLTRVISYVAAAAAVTGPIASAAAAAVSSLGYDSTVRELITSKLSNTRQPSVAIIRLAFHVLQPSP